MKRLTICLNNSHVVTLIAGIYGMNFVFMPSYNGATAMYSRS